jgi:UDP-N-acetylmuramoyl-tripeptide--D-alanyl-D-alanine ligase
MNFPLAEIAAALGTPVSGAPRAARATGWSVDSRTVAPGDLFFALRGPNHDGHAFVAEVLAKGAAAAVVDEPVEAEGVLLRTPDTLEALQSLAGWARRRWAGRLVAVTGSAGKTTTKEVIAHLLATAIRTGKSGGNLNNHVGLPLSLLRLPEDAEAAVVEIGMNHAGEIRKLAAFAAPDIGVVTNVGHAHVEFFDSIEGVAEAKRELVESLGPDGVAVLNADDARVARFARAHPGRSITFGLNPGAEVRAEQLEERAEGVRFRVHGVWFTSPMRGVHNVLNLLAGLSVARAFGIEAGALAPAIAALEAGERRGRRFVHGGITIFDDCYNSNPEAVRRMLDVLRAEPARRRIAVLGEMLELGRWSESLHREVGRYAAGCGIDLLIGIRGAAREFVAGAVEAGIPRSAAFFFDEPDQAGEYLRREAKAGDAVLLKGSRGTRVERALERLLN